MIYQRLKELREEPINFIRQQELANIIGVHVSVYCQYEGEGAIIPINHLNTLCNFFNVSFDYIFSLTNDRQYKDKKEINKELFFSRFKSFRKENNLKQNELANISKLDQTTISKIENGKQMISTDNLYYICKKYHISADYLLGKIDNPKYLK